MFSLHFSIIRSTLVPLLLLSTLCLNTALAGGIYKSVDADGNVIFTDQPLEGAETLVGEKPTSSNNAGDDDDDGLGDKDATLDENVALTPEPKNPPKQQPTEFEAPKQRLPVTVVEILTPIHDATLHDPVGKIWVELQSYPTPLKKTGLTAQLWMDGELITSGKRPMLSLPPPERGTHALVVKLVDENGRLFIQSQPTHLHIKYRVAGQK